MLIAIIIVYLLLFAVDIAPLYQKKQWPEFWINSLLGGCSLTIAMLIGMGVTIHSPEAPIREFITSMFGK